MTDKYGWQLCKTFILNRDFYYKELSVGDDLNNALGRYRASTWNVITSLLNKPDVVGGEIVIDWYQARRDNLFGTQILRHIYPGVIISYIRGFRDGTWSNWQRQVTNSDVADIPAVTIPAGDFVITSTNLNYQAGDIPVAYGYQGHSAHMIVTPHVSGGKWGITRRNPYSVTLDSTAVKFYILR